MNRLNLVGQKYNRLLVLESVTPINGRTAWKCECDCGKIKIIKTEELRSGGTKSCGCWNDEQRAQRASKMYSKRKRYSPQESSARKVWKSRYNEMPFEDFYEISQNKCYYCSCLPSNTLNAAVKHSSRQMKDQGAFLYNGLDRIDNSSPHSKDNCVPCCKYCNYSKRERSLELFKEWVIKLYNNFILHSEE
jgi:hypothetical protein